MKKIKKINGGLLKIFIVIIINLALIVSVVFSVANAFDSASNTSFKQNIENVRTLTNSYASKVSLEIRHCVNKVKSVSNYIKDYNGKMGMTEEEINEYFSTAFEDNLYQWQLIDNTLANSDSANQSFIGTLPVYTDNVSVTYRTNAYQQLAQIFIKASAENVGEIKFTSEFTDPKTLKKVFAISTTVPVLTYDEISGTNIYEYKTLVYLIYSDFINGLNSEENNNEEIYYFYDMSNIIVDSNGDYVVSTNYFQGLNFIDYISLYNDNFSLSEKSKIESMLSSCNVEEPLYYHNNRNIDCVYTLSPIPDTNWFVLSSVPLNSFHTSYNFNLHFISFVILFGSLFILDIIVVLVINAKLRIKTHEADEANKSKSIFLSSMSHDIRTPMNAIIGMALVVDRELDEPDVNKESIRDSIKSIELSGNHLLTLINDVLDISKIESGRVVLHKKDFSIAETIEKMVEICQTSINEKNINFSVNIQNLENEFVKGDSLRINQIYMNVLTNAIKYTKSRGSVSIELSETALPEHTDIRRYTFKVADTGIGMTQEFIKTIFDRFTRATDTRINSVQGTGLGMAIVKQLIDLMDGTIQIESELNIGTTITIMLDLPNVPDNLVKEKYKGINLLIIDDEKTLYENVNKLLSGNEIGVDFCPISKVSNEAIIQNCKYDIILIDYNIYSALGQNTIKEIHSKTNEKTRIVVIDNRTPTDRKTHIFGADMVISKLLFKSKLINTIESVCFSSSNCNKDKQCYEKFSDIRILAAEDNDTNWKVLRKILSHYEINIERAENGKDAVEMVKNSCEGYDIVFMDIQMPVMNGYEATKAIRNLSDCEKANIPIYAMTADIFTTDIEKCKDAGMNGHLSKPININEVINVIKKIRAELGENQRGVKNEYK